MKDSNTTQQANLLRSLPSRFVSPVLALVLLSAASITATADSTPERPYKCERSMEQSECNDIFETGLTGLRNLLTQQADVMEKMRATIESQSGQIVKLKEEVKNAENNAKTFARSSVGAIQCERVARGDVSGVAGQGEYLSTCKAGWTHVLSGNINVYAAGLPQQWWTFCCRVVPQ